MKRPIGVTLLSAFFAAGALTCLVSSATLLFPGGWLEPIWRLDPEKRAAFVRLGQWAIVLLAAVGTACTLSSVGLWRGARWGFRLALAMLIVNGVSDAVGGVLHNPRMLIGVPIASALVAYLLSRRARPFFARHA